MSAEPPARGPVRSGSYRPRRKPPKKRSSVGPLLFVIAVIGLVGGGIFYARPIVVNALIDQAVERDTLMRQAIVRALVAPRVGDQADRPLDTAGDLRSFEVKRGENASTIGRRLEEEGFVRAALPFVFVLYETGRESALQSGTYRISPSMTRSWKSGSFVPRKSAVTSNMVISIVASPATIGWWRTTQTCARWVNFCLARRPAKPLVGSWRCQRIRRCACRRIWPGKGSPLKW